MTWRQILGRLRRRPKAASVTPAASVPGRIFHEQGGSPGLPGGSWSPLRDEQLDVDDDPRRSTHLTTQRDDPRLTHGVDIAPTEMAPAYLVLSDAERARGFVRPVRRTYLHVGAPGPQFELADLTPEQVARTGGARYVKWEAYPPSDGGALGRYWTQAQLDAIDGGCGGSTTMGVELAETYARDPHFYGATFCAHCKMHRPVGEHGEFVWDEPLPPAVTSADLSQLRLALPRVGT